MEEASKPIPLDKPNEPLTVLVDDTQKPIPVIVSDVKPPPVTVAPAMVTKGEGTTLPPTTTEAADQVVEGQRRINLIWEVTQATIAVFITVATIYCEIHSIESDTIKTAFAFIVATYITRTNHTKEGGVSAEYKGR